MTAFDSVDAGSNPAGASIFRSGGIMSTIIELTSFHFNHEIHIDFDEIEFMLRVKPISTLLVKPDEEKEHTVLGMKTKSNFKVLETPNEIKTKAAEQKTRLLNE